MWKQMLTNRVTYSSYRSSNSSIHLICLMLKKQLLGCKTVSKIREASLIILELTLLCAFFQVCRSGRENKYSLGWLWSQGNSSYGDNYLLVFMCLFYKAWLYTIRQVTCIHLTIQMTTKSSNYNSRYSSYVQWHVLQWFKIFTPPESNLGFPLTFRLRAFFHNDEKDTTYILYFLAKE